MAKLLHEDASAVLLPAYGFENEGTALKHVSDRPKPVISEYFDLLRSDRTAKCYVPRLYYNGLRWDYNTFLLEKRPDNIKPTHWYPLCRMDTIKPEGSYNVLLTISGRRIYRRIPLSSNFRKQVWQRLFSADRDCFSAWLRGDNQPLSGCIIDRDDAFFKVHATRSARGVIFSREAQFDKSGNIYGYDWIAVFILAGILDKDPRKDDMLRIQAFQRRVRGNGGYEASIDDLMGNLDAEWAPALQAAADGFHATCQPVRKTVDRWRRMYLDQIKAIEDDNRKPWEEQFNNVIRSLDWQDALRLVEHPWQLEVVICKKCNQKFDNSPGINSPNYVRVQNMLKSHQCTEARREALWRMVRDFVAIRDHLWNYSGD